MAMARAERREITNRPVDGGPARDLRDPAGSSDADAQLTGLFAPAHSPDARMNVLPDFDLKFSDPEDIQSVLTS